MADDFPTILKAFILITLFAFLLIGIVTQFASDYGKDTTEIQEHLDLTTINNTIQQTKSTAEGWKTSFESQNVFIALGGVVLTGIFQLARTMSAFIITPFDIFGNIAVNVLGIPSIVLNIISALIIVALIFGIWRLVKTGSW